MGNVRKTVVMCVAVLFVTSIAFAGEVDVLVQKLVNKGILTEQEGQEILAETKAEVKKQLAEGKLDSLPKWAQNTKFSGDLRLRYENQDRAVLNDKNQLGLRFRYGFESKVNDKIKVGVRIATGSTQKQTSREQTFGDSFSTKSLWLDSAYLEYTPVQDLKLIGGKMKNPFYLPYDAMWDTDVTPEGGALQYKTAVLDNKADVFANLAVLPLDQDNNANPVIYGLQTGLSTNVFSRKLTAAATYYLFDDIKGATYANVNPYNSKLTNTITGGQFVYDYKILDTSIEYPIIDVKLFGQTMPISVLGVYIKNLADGVKKDEAWVAGLQLGKAKGPKSWELTYDYHRIAADAVLDFLNNGSLNGTGVKGHKLGLKYLLLENTELALSYYKTERIIGKKVSGDTVELVQVDATVKF